MKKGENLNGWVAGLLIFDGYFVDESTFMKKKAYEQSKNPSMHVGAG